MIVARKIQNTARAVERKKIKNYTDTERHDASNRIAANVILADPERWGEGLTAWARRFLERVK